MRLVVSECLLGSPCRYDGSAKTCDEVCALVKRVLDTGGEVVTVCPESAGGLRAPRLPAERRGDKVYSLDGTDVTSSFVLGARRSLSCAMAADEVPFAVLKSKSPSCGVGLVYDGTHTKTLVAGNGVFAQLLEERGIPMATENVVRACTPSVEHPVALVLGSGLGHLAGLVKPVRRIPYSEIPGFPASARPVAGHSFEATVGTIDTVPVVVYPGRVHLYQGYSALEVTSLVRHARRLGCRTILFACATGAVPQAAPKGLGVITDHINLTGCNPLVGWSDAEPELSLIDTGFVDMNDVYTPYLRGIAHGVANDLGLSLSEGVLAGVLGPSSETQAEVQALKTLGVSYVGMSTVLETIMAHALGMQVLGLTLATNYAGEVGVSHESVLCAAANHAEEFESLVRGILTML